MSLSHWHGKPTRAIGALLVCTAMIGMTTADAISAERMPLARLVLNPDESSGGPKYALADQSGTIQRFVEPVPGIDLEPYVGYAVKVRHDTGRTLLASQLELPGQERESILDGASDGEARPAAGVDSLFRGVLDAPGTMATQPDDSLWRAGPSPVQPAQYVQGPAAPVVIQEGMPPMQGEMQPMMGPQGVVTYDPADPSILGGSMGAYPPGAGPVYLDGPVPCGPQGCPVPCQTCPQPQMYMQPVPCPPPCPPARPFKWSIWGEALWLHPTGVDMAHAQQQDGIGGAGTVPAGLIGVVDPDYEIGIRAGAEVRFGPREAVFVQYTWYESSEASSLVAPNLPGGGGAVGSLVHHPGAALTASAGPVDASYDIDFQIGDAAYRYFVLCTNTGEVSVFAGGRFGKLEQRFFQNGIFGGGLGGAVDTSTDIDFTGGGPMAGILAEHLIHDTRFSVYGKSSVAALTGNVEASYLMFNDSTDQTLAQSQWSDDRIVPMLDYELGVMWTGPQGHLRLALGYMATFWFNMVTTPVFVDAVQADNYVDVDDTIAFDGAVGRVEWRW